MNTFLPLPDYDASAACLDRLRLGKQRLEVLTILRVLAGEVPGWRHHPAVRMWRGYAGSLVCYGLAVCRAWAVRGYEDRLAPVILRYGAVSSPRPAWHGMPALHRSHQSNLIRKLPAHYGRLWPDVPADLPYVWPV